MDRDSWQTVGSSDRDEAAWFRRTEGGESTSLYRSHEVSAEEIDDEEDVT